MTSYYSPIWVVLMYSPLLSILLVSVLYKFYRKGGWRKWPLISRAIVIPLWIIGIIVVAYFVSLNSIIVRLNYVEDVTIPYMCLTINTFLLILLFYAHGPMKQNSKAS